MFNSSNPTILENDQMTHMNTLRVKHPKTLANSNIVPIFLSHDRFTGDSKNKFLSQKQMFTTSSHY